MRSLRPALLALVLPTLAPGQAATRPSPPPPYRGLTPGISYRTFVERATALADHDTLACTTSRHTAQVMECGVGIRDPADGARFYLSGHFIEQRADMIALKDSAGSHDAGGGTGLVARTQHDLTRVFGRPHPIHRGAWEWTYGRKVVRLTWRARGTDRWVSVTLTDKDVMDRIRQYLKPRARGKT
jgi:hypothetical protein